MVRVAINGFGRIGRMFFRAALPYDDLEVVAVNDLTDTKTLAHLLKFDSVHGVLPNEVGFDENNLFIDDKALKVFAERDPAQLPWEDLGVDVVIESTGRFTTADGASKHLEAGASRVILSAPAKSEGFKTLVMGVNEHTFNPEKDFLISNASCTTNCLAPLMKVLNDNYGIVDGYFNTIHSYTADQHLVDGPHKDFRRARAAAMNIVPTTSGAAIAATEAIPELKGKVTGIAVRVPTPDGSITDFICNLKKPVNKDQVNWLFKQVSEHHLAGILRYSDDPLVSSDIVGDPHSVILDAMSTQVIDGTHLRVLGWYDNEWGYSCRMVDLVRFISGS